MRILVLQSSPNPHGSTSILVDEFSRGAREAGHEVVRVDVCKLDIAPCTGCVACGYEGPCVQHDDMDALRDFGCVIEQRSGKYWYLATRPMDLQEMIMLVDAAACSVPFAELVKLLKDAGEEMGMQIRAQREEVFDAMYKI